MSFSSLSTDALVVGSGAIGATYARLLKPYVKRVMVVESGPQLSRTPGEHVENPFIYQHQPNLSLGMLYGQNHLLSIPEQPFHLKTPSGSLFDPPIRRLNHTNPRQNPTHNMPNAAAANLVGGAFALWSCFAPSPVPFEMRYFEEHGLMSAEEWAAALPIAHRLFNTHTDAFEPSAVNRALRKVLKDKLGRELENLPMGAEKRYSSELAHFVRWTGSDTILGPLLDAEDARSKGFTLLPEHRAERLIWRGGKVKTCVVRNLATGEEIHVHADVFVIAGNAFPTPRLLWRSDIRPAALGRYLTENIIATVSVGLNNDVIDVLRADKRNTARTETVPIAFNDPSPKSGFSPTEQRPWIGHINRTARYQYYTDCVWDSRLTLDITFYGTVQPNPANRVTFEPDLLDRFGEPQLTFDYRIDRGDADAAMRMMADMTEVATTIGAYIPIETSAKSAAGVSKPFFQPPGTSWHWMGTYRMGRHDDGESVVDHASRVWGFDNLYLGGGGVIPNAVASNCTLMASAIAVKSAAAITGRSIAELAGEVGIAAG